MADQIYDKREQWDQIASGLLEGETIIAVYDAVGAGTGFIGLTNRRVIVQDRSFAGKQVALTSIPYSRVSAVAVLSNKSWAGNFFSTSAIAVKATGATYEVEFRGNDKAHHVHNVILSHIT
ncbi:MAG: PH domain-containing protein [Carbonactinosporaceae bacterium]